jgi:Spy/CpxP family protein refolding chaperone
MRASILLAALALVPLGLNAQGADSAEVFKERLRQRWHAHIVEQLQLTSDQSGKLQATEDRYDGMRQPIQRRQVEIAGELNQQLQPGVAADNDLVTRLMAERQDNRTKLQDIDRQQDQEMAGYLNPVQRVRYQRQRELFIHRIQQFREGRQARPRPRRFR